MDKKFKAAWPSQETAHWWESLSVFLGAFVVIFVFILALGLTSSVRANEQIKDMAVLKKWNIFAKIQGRGPSNFIPNDDIIAVPIDPIHWSDKMLVEDDRGVLVSIRKQIQDWQDTQEYAENWNLTSTGMYDIVENETKVKYLQKNGLKYLDKRISGEIRHAKEGSTMHTLGRVRDALRPATKVEMAKNLRLRFKARVLQGKAIMNVENPYIDTKAQAKVNGEVDVNMGKTFKKIGVSTFVIYEVNDSAYETSVEKKLTDHWKTVVSSHQEVEDMAFSKQSNRTLSFIYSKDF